VGDRHLKFHESWDNLLVKLLVNSITVLPGITKPFYAVDGKRYRFDPSLIQINWKY
jgi:hypothetical protein